MVLSAAERAQFDAAGYVVIPCPWPAGLTSACIDAVRAAEEDPVLVDSLDTIGNHWKLRPVTKGSYWSKVDHSQPFLAIHTHPEIIKVLPSHRPPH